MPLTADQIQARIDSIQAARDTGALIVRHGDTSTQYRSLAEMDYIIADLRAQLDVANGTKKRSSVNYIEQRSKGFGCGRFED